ncbi:hypothetical protein A3K80_07090 [Candidatus Bathyarchaeota archaeon RBG_13_38_9]|nr:MAG: hypothetical protein A3K80_07090 [Candidatus Bathyarchaeota archaeon RBG_13_38_9]
MGEEKSILTNGDFEAGRLRAWGVEGPAKVVKTYIVWGNISQMEATDFPAAVPHSGEYFLVLGDENVAGTISQSVKIHENATRAVISFWYSCTPTTGSKLSFWINDEEGMPVRSVNFIGIMAWKELTYVIDPKYFGQKLTIGFQGEGITNYQAMADERMRYECLMLLDDVSLIVDEPISTPTSTATTTSTKITTTTPLTETPPSRTGPPIGLFLKAPGPFEIAIILLVSWTPIAIAVLYRSRKMREQKSRVKVNS